MKKIFLTCIIFLIIGNSCQRFDSDELNHRLIQGNWMQVQIVYPHEEQDSIIVESPDGITLFQFDVDSCFEKMPDLAQTKPYHYQIKNYMLRLEEKGAKPNILEIAKLTKDSLILRSRYYEWKYIRKSLE